MAIHVLDQIVLNGLSPITNPLVLDIELGEAFLWRVSFNFEAPKVTGARISHSGLILAPWPGLGLSPWVLDNDTRYIEEQEFKRLAGPPYRLRVELFNADTLPRRIFLYFVTFHENYYPVNIMAVTENAVPKRPQPTTPNAAY